MSCQQEIICDSICIVNAICNIVTDSIVTNDALMRSQRLYNDSFVNIQNSFSNFVNKVIVIITLLSGFLFYTNYKSAKDSKEELKRYSDLENKLKEQFEIQKSKFEAQKNELEKIKATSYFTDTRDSKTYRSIKIGNQIWLAENLNYSGKDGKLGICYANELKNSAKYGRLYDWKTAKDACPEGWHLPSVEEWNTLIATISNSSNAGIKLKAISGWNWNDRENISGNGTDDCGFTALPGGLYFTKGSIFKKLIPICIGYKGVWWSATEIA